MPARHLISGLLLATLIPSPGGAEEPDRVASEASGFVLFGAGVFDFGRDADTLQLDLQWRSRPGWSGLRLQAGLMATDEDDLYAHLGLRRHFPFEGLWGLSVSAAAGAWSPGESLDLGSSLLFRTSVELYVAFSRRSRLSLELSHLSNASLEDENPGANSLSLLYGRRL